MIILYRSPVVIRHSDPGGLFSKCPHGPRIWYNTRMKIHAYAKINLILNVLGTRPDGYHEVEMLMQAIDLCDVVTVEVADAVNAADALTAAGRCESAGSCNGGRRDPAYLLGPRDFEYGQRDLAYRAALLMTETFRPELVTTALDEDDTELAAGVKGVRISIEKRIPAAAGLAGGSADAAAVITGLGRLWLTDKTADGGPGESVNDRPGKNTDELLKTLLPLGAKLGSDVPFCIASQLGRPAAIARGRGTDLEFVGPTDCGVDLYFSDVTIPNKTAAVYAELKEEDCRERFSIESFLKASSLKEKQRFVGNHLQAPAERLFGKAENGAEYSQPDISCRLSGAANEPARDPAVPSNATLCGAGPTYFTLSETGKYRTVIK